MLCAISVDLDEIPHYHAIHGLRAPSGASAHAIYEIALPRVEAFSRAHHVPLTLFVVASDLEASSAPSQLGDLARKGHEVGNHSLHHHYDLYRRTREEMVEQVREAADRIEQVTGQRPAGFRAPGYRLSDRLVEVLETCDVAYDSSLFPCPYYYMAKAGVLGAMRVARRRSAATLASPAELAAPVRPFRMGRPYWRRGKGLLELPIQVTRKARLPFIGTALTLAGPWGARMITRDVVGEPFINLELHGLDFLGGDDGLDDLVPHQLDLRIPVERKLEALSIVVEALRHAGYRFVRLAEAAAELSAKTEAGAR